jgi:hypothetical protein
LLNKTNEMQQRRIEMVERERDRLDESIAAAENGFELEREDQEALSVAEQEERDIQAVQEMITNHRKAQLESTIGKSAETEAEDQAAFVKKLLGYGALFVILGGITLLWGFFYFPAACAVAGYTRSFVATINPSVGLDTIKRLGGTYALILLMSFLLFVASGIVSMIFSIIFLPLDLPSVGNLPAKFLGSMVGFYFSVVFACVIGFALYRNASKLKLYQ